MLLVTVNKLVERRKRGKERLCQTVSGAPEGPKGRGGTPEKRALGPRFRGHSPNLKGTLPLLALRKLIRFVKQFIPRFWLS